MCGMGHDGGDVMQPKKYIAQNSNGQTKCILWFGKNEAIYDEEVGLELKRW